MTLVHPIFDSDKLTCTINDPIKTIYVQSDKELIPGSNYYISLHIAGEPISFTNKFKKVVVDGIELYELDFFAQELIIQMQLCLYSHNNGISVFGWHYSPVNGDPISLSAMNQLTDIYYEKGDSINLTNYRFDNGRGDRFLHSAAGIIDQVITYHDSELSQKLRLERSASDPRKTYGIKCYRDDMDNVLRYLSYMQGLAYDNDLRKILPSTGSC